MQPHAAVATPPRATYTPQPGFFGDDEFAYAAMAKGCHGQQITLRVQVKVTLAHGTLSPMSRIALISDTHNLLRPEAMDFLAGCDHIVHGGDIGGPDFPARLSAIAPVRAK